MTLSPLQIAFAQISARVGDIKGNADHIIDLCAELSSDPDKAGCDLVMTPELILSGYPAEDFLLRPDFLRQIHAGIDRIASASKDWNFGLLLGTPYRVQEGDIQTPDRPNPIGHPLCYNAMLLIEKGKVSARIHKQILPNEGVFDERRVFLPGHSLDIVTFRGWNLGVLICEDMWNPAQAQSLAQKGADILLVANASPFEQHKFARRLKHAKMCCDLTNLPLLYGNLVGAQDELVFDGGSFLCDAPKNEQKSCQEDLQENLKGQSAFFAPALFVTKWSKNKKTPATGEIVAGGHSDAQSQTASKSDHPHDANSDNALIWQAMMCGLRAYIWHNGMQRVILGLSGGIDSAFTAAVAADALGADKVTGVILPGPFTSAASREDARAFGENLGIALQNLDITPLYEQAMALLDHPMGVTAENLQARLRGLILMGLSNRDGALLLTTGNKSELAVGYTTLYGDMNGAFSVIKDIYKSQLYTLANWRNHHLPPGCTHQKLEIFSQSLLTKAPSAELRPDQKDQDSLPDYPLLDQILSGMIEENQSCEALISQGFAPELVRKIWHLLHNSEFKRYQAPPGVKLTRKAFGRDWRYPLTKTAQEL